MSPASSHSPLPQTPPPVTSWKALDSSSWDGRPPDPQIAASTTHIVITLTRWIAFYDKAGNLLKSTSSKDFFSPLGLYDGTNEGIDIYSDMRVIFDGYRKRFWVCALARSKFTNAAPRLPPEKRRSLVTVAISKTEDPNQGWWKMYYGWPAVEVNQKFDAVLVYARSGNSIFPEARFSVFLGDEKTSAPAAC